MVRLQRGNDVSRLRLHEALQGAVDGGADMAARRGRRAIEKKSACGASRDAAKSCWPHRQRFGIGLRGDGLRNVV